ncbi:MAG: hypothetical protein JW973_18610 [Bacteroidales bacterium]|nr:hypothetical protein [Bacteroidales bacterium]
MKTKNYLRNAALMLIMVFPAYFANCQGENDSAYSFKREKAEFAGAGFWIDAVVVTPAEDKTEKELLAGFGYYIEPVVVTYARKTNVSLDKMGITNTVISMSSASDKDINTLQVSLLGR